MPKLVRRVYVTPWDSKKDELPMQLYCWSDGRVTWTPTHDGSPYPYTPMTGDDLVVTR